MRVRPIFAQIKRDFLALPTEMYSWGWSEHSIKSVYTWIVQAALLLSGDEAGVTLEEARCFLRQIDQNGRQQVIWFLGRVGADNKQGWEKLVVPFIQGAWPRERRFQTESTSKAWVSMLDDTNDAFPIVLNAVHDFLRTIHSPHLGLYRFHRGAGDTEPLTGKYPRETLDLLDTIVPDDPRGVPYDLSQVLNLLLDTEPGIATDRRYKRLRELDASR